MESIFRHISAGNDALNVSPLVAATHYKLAVVELETEICREFRLGAGLEEDPTLSNRKKLMLLKEQQRQYAVKVVYLMDEVFEDKDEGGVEGEDPLPSAPKNAPCAPETLTPKESGSDIDDLSRRLAALRAPKPPAASLHDIESRLNKLGVKTESSTPIDSTTNKEVTAEDIIEMTKDEIELEGGIVGNSVGCVGGVGFEGAVEGGHGSGGADISLTTDDILSTIISGGNDFTETLLALKETTTDGNGNVESDGEGLTLTMPSKVDLIIHEAMSILSSALDYPLSDDESREQLLKKSNAVKEAIKLLQTVESR